MSVGTPVIVVPVKAPGVMELLTEMVWYSVIAVLLYW